MTNVNEDQSQAATLDEYIDPITKRLMQTREKLIDREAPAFYVGDPVRKFKYQVVWKCVGNGNKLVTKESATAVEKTEEVQATTSESNLSQDTSHTHTSSTTPTDSVLEPAILSAIVFINFDDCWLTPCGFWKEPTNVTKNSKT